MTNTIRATVGYNDWKGIEYYQDFDIVKELPELGEDISHERGLKLIVQKIARIYVDGGVQGWEDFDYYEIELERLEEGEEPDNDYLYMAIEKQNEEEEGGRAIRFIW